MPAYILERFNCGLSLPCRVTHRLLVILHTKKIENRQKERRYAWLWWTVAPAAAEALSGVVCLKDSLVKKDKRCPLWLFEEGHRCHFLANVHKRRHSIWRGQCWDLTYLSVTESKVCLGGNNQPRPMSRPYQLIVYCIYIKSYIIVKYCSLNPSFHLHQWVK